MESRQAISPTIPSKAVPAADAEEFDAPPYSDNLDIPEGATLQTAEFTDHSAIENSSEEESLLSEEKMRNT